MSIPAAIRAAKTTSELKGKMVAAKKDAISSPQYPYSVNPSSIKFEINSACGLMGYKPVLPNSQIRLQWNLQFESILHLRCHNLLQLGQLLRYDVEIKFVVHLQDHFRTHLFLLKSLENAYHRQLDDICSAS